MELMEGLSWPGRPGSASGWLAEDRASHSIPGCQEQPPCRLAQGDCSLRQEAFNLHSGDQELRGTGFPFQGAQWDAAAWPLQGEPLPSERAKCLVHVAGE